LFLNHDLMQFILSDKKNAATKNTIAI